MEILKAIWTVYTTACIIFTTMFLIGLFRSLRKALGSKETEELVEKLQQHIKVVYVEQVCGMYHLYDKINNSFIAQGYTEDEMWTNAHLTFPKQEFIIEGENGNAVLVSVKDNK
jgi:hypothetical protein